MDCINLSFTRPVNQFFGSESSPVPFSALFAFFAVNSTAEFKPSGAPICPLLSNLPEAASAPARGNSTPWKHDILTNRPLSGKPRFPGSKRAVGGAFTFHATVQSTTSSPGTRENSRTLFVTTVPLAACTVAAIHKSASLMAVPCASRGAAALPVGTGRAGRTPRCWCPGSKSRVALNRP